ncbi:MAG: MarR family winged helix-turn-helix transcriptional regulator [Flavobacteriales bacterium]
MPGIEEELRSRFISEQQKAMLNLLFTANWLRAREVSRFKPYGISPQQYNILRILRGAKGRMRAQSVKERMIDRAPNATRLADKLIAKGLVRRERSAEDRRVIHIRITLKGLALLQRIERESGAELDRLLGRISEAEARALNRRVEFHVLPRN